jgi:acyl-CoA synthetase (AMP-forming)/AMP-acid ligase II
MLIAILAALKAGAAYVPLDGGIVTDSTLLHVTIDSGSQVIAVGKDWADRIDQLNAQLAKEHKTVVSKVVLEDVISEAEIDLDDRKSPDQVGQDEFSDAGKGCDGCYVIYTSG